MTQRKKSGPIAKVKVAHRQAADTDVSEAFRRARSSISQITTDLDHLRHRAASAVKGGRRPAKSK